VYLHFAYSLSSYKIILWFKFISLENALRNFATLTKGDIITVNYNEKVCCNALFCLLF
jgi:hypothetical protein